MWLAATERFVVWLLRWTGLRVSEACALTLQTDADHRSWLILPTAHSAGTALHQWPHQAHQAQRARVREGLVRCSAPPSAATSRARRYISSVIRRRTSPSATRSTPESSPISIPSPPSKNPFAGWVIARCRFCEASLQEEALRLGVCELEHALAPRLCAPSHAANAARWSSASCSKLERCLSNAT